MNIELLQQLCEASAVSGDEQEVRLILIDTLEPCVDEITFDGLGSFVARKGTRGPKVAIVGHMDEVGFMVTHIDESGFIRFTTIGGWWNQSTICTAVGKCSRARFQIHSAPSPSTATAPAPSSPRRCAASARRCPNAAAGSNPAA